MAATQEAATQELVVAPAGTPLCAPQEVAMHAVIYRWKLRPGSEDEFVEHWAHLTTSIRRTCGSYGSRLHRGEDGIFVAYALWPDAETQRACEPDDTQAAEGMRLSIDEDFEPMHIDVVTDLLAEPSSDGVSR